MARRPTLHDVEVVDETPDDGTGAPAPAEADEPAPRRRWPLVVGAALVAVLVAVGVTGQVVLDRRERARLAVVAAHPSGLLPVDRPPVALWEADADDFYAAGAVRSADGLLVGVRPTDEGTVVVAATDAATGREVWTVEVLEGAEPSAEPDEQGFAARGSCTAHGTQEHLVVCLVHDTTQTAGSPQAAGASPSRVVVLDTRDGTAVRDLTDALAADGQPLSLAVLDDLVVATVLGTPDGTAVRAASTDGTPRWSVTLRTPDEPEQRRAWVERAGDLLAVIGTAEVVLLDRDGTTLRTHSLATGYAYVWDGELRIQVVGGSATTIVRPEGDVEVEGYVAHAIVDDGSVPGLTVTTDDDDTMAAWTGSEPRWTSDVAPWGLHVLDGRLVLDDGRRVVALDARTGAEVWESDAVRGLPVTDGRVLLGVARVAERGQQAQMVALDVADGSELWRAPLPEGTTQLLTYAQLLLAASDDEGSPVTVLG